MWSLQDTVALAGGGALQEDDDEIIIKRVRQRLGRCLAGAGSDILVGTVAWMKFKETRSSSE